MHKKLLISLILLIGNVCVRAQTFPYERDWGTYYGNKTNTFQDAVVDTNGNVYSVSNIGSNVAIDDTNYTTPNAHQTTYGGGSRDILITKTSIEGDLVWATYFGGESFDESQQIAIDGENNIYVVGKTSSLTNIATPDGYQTTMVESNGIELNELAGFIVKFSSEGELLYGTYYDGEKNDFIFAVEISETHVYAYGKSNSTTHIATPNSFQATLAENDANQSSLFLVKFTQSGERVWATYYGHDFEENSIFLLETGGIGLDNGNNVYISGNTNENLDYYASSETVYQPQNPGNISSFITKFDAEGNRVWSTYFGGTSTDVGINLRLHNNFIYMSGFTYSQGIGIGNVHQIDRLGAGDDFLLKMDLEGQPVWSTYFGGSGSAGNRSYISFGDNGSIWLTGLTSDTDGIATEAAYQTSLNMGTGIQYNDVYFARFTDSGQLDFASYYGGEHQEYWGAKALKTLNDEFYIVGTTSSFNGIASEGALQETVITESANDNFETLFIGKFKPKSLGFDSFDTLNYGLWPNPTTGVVTLTHAKDVYFNLNCYDVQGRLVKRERHLRTNTPIDLQDLSSGVYFLEVTSDTANKQMFKVIFE